MGAPNIKTLAVIVISVIPPGLTLSIRVLSGISDNKDKRYAKPAAKLKETVFTKAQTVRKRGARLKKSGPYLLPKAQPIKSCPSFETSGGR